MCAMLALIVAASIAGPALAAGRRPIVPVVVGEIGAGLVLGRSGLGWVGERGAPPPALSPIGFILLMFTAGAHIDFGAPAFRAGVGRGLAALGLVAVAAVSG